MIESGHLARRDVPARWIADRALIREITGDGGVVIPCGRTDLELHDIHTIGFKNNVVSRKSREVYDHVCSFAGRKGKFAKRYGMRQEADIAPDLREFEPVVEREEEIALVGAAHDAQPVMPGLNIYIGPRLPVHHNRVPLRCKLEGTIRVERLVLDGKRYLIGSRWQRRHVSGGIAPQDISSHQPHVNILRG